MFSRTTGEESVEQSAPLTIAVDGDTDCVTAPHALVVGTVGGAGAGEDGDPPPPPHAAASASRITAAARVITDPCWRSRRQARAWWRAPRRGGAPGAGEGPGADARRRRRRARGAPCRPTARAPPPLRRSTACRACR